MSCRRFILVLHGVGINGKINIMGIYQTTMMTLAIGMFILLNEGCVFMIELEQLKTELLPFKAKLNEMGNSL